MQSAFADSKTKILQFFFFAKAAQEMRECERLAAEREQRQVSSLIHEQHIHQPQAGRLGAPLANIKGIRKKN